MNQTELQKRLQLLEEYAETIQRQNFAKNNETALLYQQIASIQEQNNMLKGCIEAMKERQRNINQNSLFDKASITESRNFEAELKASIDMNSMKIVADDIRIQLEKKEEQIQNLSQQNKQLMEDLSKVKQELNRTADRVIQSEEKLRKQYEQMKKLQEQNYNMKSLKSEGKGISFARLEVDKLVRQNNQLIEKIRILEKQKNNYYSQLRMTSPLKSRSPNSKIFLQLSRKKGGKADRWNIMEQKIKAIRNENEQLKANLAIE